MIGAGDSGGISIEPLGNRREVIPLLARWHHGQWASINPGETLRSRTARLENHAGNVELPLTWVALEEGRLLGSASLVPSDMETRPELEPWLASVFVDPGARGRGVGSLLVKFVMGEARGRGFRQLYLFTPDRQRFYQRLGWRERESLEYRETLVTLMEVDL